MLEGLPVGKIIEVEGRFIDECKATILERGMSLEFYIESSLGADRLFAVDIEKVSVGRTSMTDYEEFKGDMTLYEYEELKDTVETIEGLVMATNYDSVRGQTWVD